MGWLDKYEDGGSFDGLTDKGFNYNGAWGGQFQFGGEIDWNKAKRISEAGLAGASMIPGPVGYAASVAGSGIDAYDAYQAYQRGDTQGALTEAGQAALGLIPYGKVAKKFFNLGKGAEFIGKTKVLNEGLKGAKALNRLADISDVVQLKKKQSGGSLPGSVGFTYARTGSIPSNGKYAKKTMASAQSGIIIDDEMGQWRHPGEITRIPSNNITMKGVDYPVLGISDEGDKKLMQPGKNYKFKGKRVTEIPIAKDGSQLTKLDQLTNFTNYNTPQPGGWLDKYNK